MKLLHKNVNLLIVNLSQMMTKTYLPNPATVQRDWYVVDAADQRLGRLATEIAMILRGKNKPQYKRLNMNRSILSQLNISK